jgi:hypothetical protein
VSEYEFEPVAGLPERLPEGERILWQGSPSWRALAVRALHVRKVAVYFLILVLWHVADSRVSGSDWVTALQGAAWLALLGVTAIGLLTLLARAMARTTLHTITNERVVMRFGVAMPMAVNLPFKVIESAGMKAYPDGTADIPITTSPDQRIGYFVTWPHVRPLRVFRVQPMLRCIAGGEQAARTLAAALAAATPEAGPEYLRPQLPAQPTLHPPVTVGGLPA